MKKKTLKTLCRAGLLSALVLTFFSCIKETETKYVVVDSGVNDDGLTITSRSIPVLDEKRSPETATIYEIQDVDRVYMDATWFYDMAAKKSSGIDFSRLPVYDTENNTLSFSLKSLAGDHFIFTLNWKEDTITISNSFYTRLSEERPSFINEMPSYYSGDKGVTYNLKKYGYDILYYHGKCLIPQDIGRTIFLAPMFVYSFYNGEYIKISYSSITSNIEFASIILPTVGKKQSKQQSQDAYNSLKFTFENFFGLGFTGDRNIPALIEGRKNDIMNPDPVVSNQAIHDFLALDLNDGHTSKGNNSFYVRKDQCKERNGSFDIKYFELQKKYSSAKYGPNKTIKVDDVRFSPDGKTAIINFDSFFGPDTMHQFMSSCMAEIETKENSSGTAVKNIVLDIVTNGGGSVNGLRVLLGFMTKGPLYFSMHNLATNSNIVYNWKVDTNNDGSYDSNDGYSRFKWFILTSEASYSCANTLTTIAKFTGLAKVIGRVPGGGICSVTDFHLSNEISGKTSSIFRLQAAKLSGGKFEFYHYPSNDRGVNPDYVMNANDITDEQKIYAAVNYVNSI